MLKKTIEFTDYNGNKRVEDHYFNLTDAEITEMELSTVGGLTQMLQGIIAAQDMPAIIKFVKQLILTSYGQKSADGRRFIKSKELSEEFSQTEAYAKLFMELATNEDATSAFVNGLISDDLRKAIADKEKKDLKVVE
jgi:hypothetical protein